MQGSLPVLNCEPAKSYHDNDQELHAERPTSTWPNKVTFISRVADRGGDVQQRALNALHIVGANVTSSASTRVEELRHNLGDLRPCIRASSSAECGDSGIDTSDEYDVYAIEPY